MGYGTTGPQVNAAVNQYNFMGTGRTVGLAFDASWWGQNYSFNYYNPFYTKTGIGRGMDVYFQKVDPKHLDVSIVLIGTVGTLITLYVWAMPVASSSDMVIKV